MTGFDPTSLSTEIVHKFVRNGERIVIGDGYHEELLAKAGLTEEGVRDDEVDMGLLLRREENRFLLMGDSTKYRWPPRERHDIRQRTVEILREQLPTGFEVH